MSRRHAFVTGAGSGIGKAIALALAGSGHAVSLAGRRAAPLEAVRDEIHASGGKAFVHDGFDVTDAAPLPDGGLVVLERRFRFSEGVKMRIRRIDARELKRGALIAGEVLLEANDSLNIDNMEGIAAHRGASGEIVLTLITDDNFSPLQRTLIYQFELAKR